MNVDAVQKVKEILNGVDSLYISPELLQSCLLLYAHWLNLLLPDVMLLQEAGIELNSAEASWWEIPHKYFDCNISGLN